MAEAVPRCETGPRFPFWVLVRYRGVQLRNTLDQHLREAPLRAFSVVLLLVGIWGALYLLLSRVLQQVGRWELVAVVANQYIFIHFFLVLAVMLAFSSAVLSYGALFGRREGAHLLSMPASPHQVVCLKWIEGMLLSSWSFLLLGVPLMLAVASNGRVEWYYYPLFIGHFLAFVLIPSTLGLLAAWVVAMWAPRRPLLVLGGGAVIIIAIIGFWYWRVAQHPEMSGRWLYALEQQLNLAKQPLLPSTWTAKGVVAAMEEKVSVSLLYLGAVLANGAFFAWLVINLLGSSWARAYNGAQRAKAAALVRNGWFTEGLVALLFCYLPQRMRALMLKDVRGFARDATQWMQMAIMIGLLIVYAVNLKRLPRGLGSPGIRIVLAFLNLTVISLILATFTSRFVFPLLSLESQQLWLLGLVPTRRRTILWVKFLFSVTVTGLSGLFVVGLSVRALALPTSWVWMQWGVCLGVCVGLSGLAVGLGARFPVLGQRNPARIAAGFGGTLNLVASMLFVGLEMAGLALAGFSHLRREISHISELHVALWAIPLLVLFGLAVAGVSIHVGGKYFEKLEV